MKVLVFDFGGTNLKYALMNGQYEFLENGSVIAPKNSKEDLFSTVISIYNQYQEQIDGVAISFAGRIDSKNGYAYHGGSYQFIKNVELKKQFEELLQCRVTIMNDAECAMLAEYKRGHLQGVHNAAAIIIGTAIGGSLLINDKIYSGSHFNTGEVSSIIVDPNDEHIKRYWFGHNSYRGLTETYENINSLERGSISGKDFFENIDEGKRLILKQFCYDMANQIYNFQCFLDVEKVVIGGGISQQPVLIKMISEEVTEFFEKLSVFQVIPPEICACQYGNDANLIGALIHYIETNNEN